MAQRNAKKRAELERLLKQRQDEVDAGTLSRLALVAELDKLAAFKAYVHQRLDDAGVPTDPESPHRAAGCRIGGRLDHVLGALDLVFRPDLAGRDLVSLLMDAAGAINAAGGGPLAECLRAKAEDVQTARGGR